MIRDILTYFADIQPFLEDITDLAPKIRDRLLPMLQDQEQKERLQLEIAIVVDAGEPLVKATYNLEGDGPLALTAYKILQEVSTAEGNKPLTTPTPMQSSGTSLMIRSQSNALTSGSACMRTASYRLLPPEVQC